MKKVHLLLPDDLLKTVDLHIPAGLRSTLFRSVLKMIIASVQKHGPGIFGLIVTNDVELTPVNRERQILTHSKSVKKDGQQSVSQKII